MRLRGGARPGREALFKRSRRSVENWPRAAQAASRPPADSPAAPGARSDSQPSARSDSQYVPGSVRGSLGDGEGGARGGESPSACAVRGRRHPAASLHHLAAQLELCKLVSW